MKRHNPYVGKIPTNDDLDWRGSPKQIAWAKSIRTRRLSEIISAYDEVKKRADEARGRASVWASSYRSRQVAEMAAGRADLAVLFLELLPFVADAKWWIDNRDAHISSILERGQLQQHPHMDKRMRNPAPKTPPKRIRFSRGAKQLRIMAPMARVYAVDMDVVRSQWPDIIGGSHHRVDAFVPKDEIWIEAKLGAKRGRFILAHEMIEKLLMDGLGWKYEKAHAAANDLEFDLRTLAADRQQNETVREVAPIMLRHLLKHFRGDEHMDKIRYCAEGMASSYIKY